MLKICTIPVYTKVYFSLYIFIRITDSETMVKQSVSELELICPLHSKLVKIKHAKAFLNAIIIDLYENI